MPKRNKKCTVCGKIKEVEGFHKDKSHKGGYYSCCKTCRSIEQPRKRWYQNNKNKVKNGALIRAYGITLDGYNKMFQEQQGCCAICGKHQSESGRAFAVDHCHKSGKIRKLLCLNCNAVLGHVNDDIDLLREMILYVEAQS